MRKNRYARSITPGGELQLKQFLTGTEQYLGGSSEPQYAILNACTFITYNCNLL